MKRFALILFFLCTPLFAQSPPFLIQRDGVIQFGANFLQHDPSSPTYNFCETLAACGGVTPPPNDPGAYTTLPVTWINHGDRRPHTIDVTQCANVWGRIEYTLPAQPWDYANGAEVSWQKASDKYLRCRISLPTNPGVAPIFFKTDSNNTTVPVRFAIVPAGGVWPVGTATACYTPLAVSNRPAIWANPIIVRADGSLNKPQNNSQCSVFVYETNPQSGQYDLLIDSTAGQRGLIGISKN